MELDALIRPLRKWWWLILLSTLVAAGVSYAATSRLPSVYEARATLLVGNTIGDPNPTGTQFTLGEQLAGTYASIAMRDPMRRAVREALGLDAIPSYSVTALPRSQLLEVRVTDTSPQRAQAVAAEVANQLVALSPSNLQPEEQEMQAFIDEQLDTLRVRIRETEDELAARQDELAGLFSAQEIEQTQQAISALETKLNTLQANFASLLAGTQTNALNTISIIEPATEPLAPIPNQQMMTVAVASAAGMALAIGAAFLMEYSDISVRTAADVARASAARTLANIPRFPEKRYPNKLVTLQYPSSPLAEAYRRLRTALYPTLVDEHKNLLLLTSLNRSDGKSVTAANLAVALAQMGRRVLLLDANLRRPSQHVLFEMENEQGTAELFGAVHGYRLEPEAVAEQVDELLPGMVRETAQPNLTVITSGQEPPNPAELLASSGAGLLLRELARRYDIVIVDSPPCLHVTDALALNRHVDNVLLVIRSGANRPSEVKDAVTMLQEADSTLLGVVLNLTPAGRDNYYFGRPYTKTKSSKRLRFFGNQTAAEPQAEG